jgi:hypothetical protein
MRDLCAAKPSFINSSFSTINEVRNVYVSLDDADPYASPPKDTSETVLEWASVPIVKWYVSQREIISKIIQYINSAEGVAIEYPSVIGTFLSAFADVMSAIDSSSLLPAEKLGTLTSILPGAFKLVRASDSKAHALALNPTYSATLYNFIPNSLSSHESVDVSGNDWDGIKALVDGIVNDPLRIITQTVAGQATVTPSGSTPDYWSSGMYAIGAETAYFSRWGADPFSGLTAYPDINVKTGFSEIIPAAYTLSNSGMVLARFLMDSGFESEIISKFVPNFLKDMLEVLAVMGDLYDVLTGTILLSQEEIDTIASV